MLKYIAFAIILLMSGTAHAEPLWLTKFRQDGKVPPPYGLDFTMQEELNHVLDGLKDKIDASNASTIAISAMPEETGSMSMGIGTAGKELGLAIGYKERFNELSTYKFILSTNSDGDTMVGAGYTLKMW